MEKAEQQQLFAEAYGTIETEEVEAPAEIPILIATDVTVFKSTFAGEIDVVSLIMSGYDPDDESREIVETLYVLGSEDALETARRIKSVAATVKPLRKQIPTEGN